MERLDEHALPLPLLAKRCALSEPQLRRMVNEGRLPCTRFGRSIYIFPTDARRVLGALYVG